MKSRWSAILLCLALIGAGCSYRQVPSSRDYYNQGEWLYEHMVWKGAIDNYQHLVDQYPFSPLAEKAELKIGLTYYRMHDYPEAIGAFSDFIRMHPMNKELPTAMYYLGMSYFVQMHGADLDQSNTLAAITQFRALEQRFPESPYAELAHQQIEVGRQVLARSNYLIGMYYAKRANFPAAESRLAGLLEKYPETPIAPQALYELGLTLQKEGKRYSAAQAFAAVDSDYGKSNFAAPAKKRYKKLNEPVDREVDPLRLVLAESGFGPPEAEAPLYTVQHHESALDGNNGVALSAAAAKAADSSAGTQVILRRIRLAASPNPISVIFDMSGPAKFEKHFDSGPGWATLSVRIPNAQPDPRLGTHLVFDKSIFHDADIHSDADGTTVTIHTTKAGRAAIIPLEDPPRLLITFITEDRNLSDAAADGY